MDDLQTFRASDGYEFYYRHYEPKPEARARLVFLHGIRSHGEWYTRSCEAFAQAGIEVFFLDRRGAGINTTHRGDIPSFRRLLDDVAEFVRSVRKERGWLPLFLAGISWGGKLAAALPYRRPGLVDGLVLLCPGLRPQIAPPLAQRLRIALARAFRPGQRFPIPLNEPDLFTASLDWQKYIANDALGLRLATARFLFASFGLDLYLKRAVKHINIPVLVTLAEHDRVIDNPKTRSLVSSLPTETTLIEYAGSHHTLEFEPAAHPWVRDVLSWIAARRT